LGPTFSTAIPGKWFRENEETEIFNYTTVTGSAALTHFWVTGDGECDNIVIRYYVDGETTPSIEFTPSMAAGVGFDDETSPWGNDLGGKGAYTGGWFNNAIVPFATSLRITFHSPKALVLWTIIRGSEHYPLVLRGMNLPKSARLRLFKYSAENQPLDYVTLAAADKGAGMVYQTTLAVQSANLNFLEGCYRMYTSRDMTYPGVLLSSGTEDFFSSAYYFDAGQYRLPESGLSHMNYTDGTFSAYRFLDRDPVAFHGGFSLVWRVGDTQDPATGLKCTLQSGGNPVGSPQVSNVTAYTWVYVWDESDDIGVKTIGTALSQGYMTKEEKVLFEYNVTSNVASSAMTHFWMTSSGQADDVLIRYYIDGETTPSISFLTSLAAGVSPDTDNAAPWGVADMGHQAKTGAWVNKFLVPFGSSIRITYALPPSSTAMSACFYAIVRGLEGMPLQVGAVTLPSSARLRLHHVDSMPLDDFQFVKLVDLQKGSGMLYLTTMAVESGDLNFLEGCIHAYTSASMQWPGVLLSTGTEDFFDSAYYFDAGEFHGEVAGLTRMTVNSSHASWSAYRFQQSDPVTFHNGFVLQWRNGDKNDAHGIKCFVPDGMDGIPAGKVPRTGLTKSTLTAYTWTYEWPDNDINDPQITTFGTGVSSTPVNTSETEFYSYTLGGESTHGVMTHFWITGTNGHDDTIVRYYFDGETTPSIEFTPAMAAGVGFGDETAPWNAGEKMGKGAHTGAWWFNFPMPFQKSVRVTYQAARDGIIYAIIRGAENLPISVGKEHVALPPTSRLRLLKSTATPSSLDFVTLAALPAQSKGFIYLTAMTVDSGNLNFLEGCFRYYPTIDTVYPGVLLSSGSEDYYDSAFYFNAGPYRFSQSGLTHMDTSKGAQVSAYHFHDSDPVYFTDGFSLIWRNGETTPNDGNTKCIHPSGGTPIGSPTASTVNAYTWVYTY